MKKIGICAHSYEGGALCFLTACRHGASLLGPHMHPSIVLSAIPMGLSMPGWEADDYQVVAKHLSAGIQEVDKGGAEFFICPDNTAHIILESIIDTLPIPGLHIADVVCKAIVDKGWKKVGLLGTKWTMTGRVYEKALMSNGLLKIIPSAEVRSRINDSIFTELCQGVFKQTTIDYFVQAIQALKSQGAECVILGCTEIPLIISDDNSPLPILDSTRLLAKCAVDIALSDDELIPKGWIDCK